MVVEMDRARRFKFGMRGISFIEKKFNKPINKIDFENLTMEEVAVIMQGGLVHEDDEIIKKTPDDIMKIIDKKDNLEEVLEAMGEAMKEMQGKKSKKQ